MIFMNTKSKQTLVHHIRLFYFWFFVIVSILYSTSCSPLYYYLFQTQEPKKESTATRDLITLLLLSPNSVTYPWGTFTDNRDGTISFQGRAGSFGGQSYSESTLTYAKCSSGQTWISSSNSCSPEVPTTLLYCPTNDNSCNDVITFLLNNVTSDAYSYCDSLVLTGKSNWRVATKNELKLTVECSENPVNFPADNAGGCGVNKSYYLNTSIFQLGGNICSFWSASAVTAGVSWFVDFCSGATSSSGKALARHVRCVTDP
ncbi:DUF1566 domain-containing protein [Leptospira sp. WS39.C2]